VWRLAQPKPLRGARTPPAVGSGLDPLNPPHHFSKFVASCSPGCVGPGAPRTWLAPKT